MPELIDWTITVQMTHDNGRRRPVTIITPGLSSAYDDSVEVLDAAWEIADALDKIGGGQWRRPDPNTEWDDVQVERTAGAQP